MTSTTLIDKVSDALVGRHRLPYATAQAFADTVNTVVAEHQAALTDPLESRPALHRGASEAQRLTADELHDRGVGRKRLNALSLVARAGGGGVTCDELERRTGIPHQSLSSALNWLERNGLAERDLDDKRRTVRGGWANPYVVTDVGTALLSMQEA